jgi:hypothetical protein
MLQIQVQPLPSQEFQVVLDGQECVISLYQRMGRLYMDVAAGGVSVVRGAICQHAADVIQTQTRDFAGQLRWYDAGGHSSPEWRGIGERYFLLYFGADEPLPEVI